MSDLTLPVNIQYRRDAVAANRDNSVQLLCEVEASSILETTHERPPLHIAIVIDRSWSMKGDGIENAKACALHVLSELGPQDRLSILSYGDDVTIEVPLQAVTEANKTQIQQAIVDIELGGLTNIYDGWREARYQLLPEVSPTIISRVLLLSDGRITAGELDEDIIFDHCLCAKLGGVSTTTIGMGRMFTEVLLTKMAQKGGGNSYYCETPASLISAFAEEIDQLKRIVAQNIQMTIQSNHDVQVLNAHVQPVENGAKTVDLSMDSKAWLAFQIDVSEKRAGRGDGKPVQLGVLMVSYTDMQGEEHRSLHALKLPSMRAEIVGVMTDNAAAAERLDQVTVSKLYAQASQAAQANDWTKVSELIEVAKRMARDNDWLRETIAKIEVLAMERDKGMFAKRAMYDGMSLSLRLAALEERLQENEEEEPEDESKLSDDLDSDELFDRIMQHHPGMMSPGAYYRMRMKEKEEAKVVEAATAAAAEKRKSNFIRSPFQ